MKEPLISVIIATYNRPLMLKRAIESVFNQDYINFELIVIDDSDDKACIKENISITSRESVLYTENLRLAGGCGARNSGLDLASGEYIAFLDDDDYWSRHRLSNAVEQVKKYREYDVFVCSYILVDELYGVQKVITDDGVLDELDLLSGRCPATPGAVLFKNTENISNVRFDEALPAYQDLDFWLRISRYSKLLIFKEPDLYFVRHQGDRVSQNILKRLRGLDLFLEKWKNEYENYDSLKRFKLSQTFQVYMNNSQLVSKYSYIESLKLAITCFRYARNIDQVKMILICLFGFQIKEMVLKLRYEKSF